MTVHPKTFVKVWLCIVAGFVVTVLFVQHYCVLNWSESLPIGLYLKTSNRLAPDAVFCLEGAALADAISRGLPRRGGVCPNGSKPLLKPVFRGGALILMPYGFTLEHGEILPNTAPKLIGVNGKRLAHYPFGPCKQEPGQLWMISTYNPNSYDARYFGEIPESQVLFYARPLFVF